MSGTEPAYGAVECPRRSRCYQSTGALRDVRYWASVWCYEMCGTELAYDAIRSWCVGTAPSSTTLGLNTRDRPLPARFLCDARYCLRASCAMPGTPYALPMRCPVLASYAMPGTAYALPMRCP
eukprot:2356956-Rhodomonas_salina.4